MEPFIGSEAVASGQLTRGQLRWNYKRIHPDVYVAADVNLDLFMRAYGASLWTRGEGVVSGLAAARLHGVDGIPDSTPIELIGTSRRAPRGVVVRNERIESDEIQTIAGMRVTKPARTALEVARRLPRDAAVVQLDKLAAVARVDEREVESLLARYRGARGIARAYPALDLIDGGTRNPQETRLRLLLHDTGLPRPETSICLEDRGFVAVLGMGWRGPKIGVSVVLDDEVRHPYLNEQLVRREAAIQRLRWIEVKVASLAPKGAIAHRIREQLTWRAQ